MAVRRVVRLPATILKQRAGETEAEQRETLARDLVDTMRASPACVGLAAPQIGVPLRGFVVDVSEHPKTTTCHGTVVMFNPVVLEAGPHDVGREGCLSVPDLTANVRRAASLVVRGVDPDGEELVIATEGFEARAYQHEIDHLDGVLFIDHLSEELRRQALAKLREQSLGLAPMDRAVEVVPRDAL